MLFSIKPIIFPLEGRVHVSRTLKFLELDNCITIEDISQRVLKDRESFYVCAPRGFGKTSLLNEIAFRINQEKSEMLLLGPVNLESAEPNYNSLVDLISGLLLHLELPTQINLLKDFPLFHKKVIETRGKPTRFLILLDDLDAMPSKEMDQFLKDIEKSLKESDGHLQIACTSQFLKDERKKILLPLHKLATGYTLEPFEIEEINDFIEQTERAFGITIDTDAQTKIYDLSQGIPYLVQALMQEIEKDSPQKGQVIDANHLDKLIPQLISPAVMYRLTRPLLFLSGTLREDTQELINGLIQHMPVGDEWEGEALRNLRRFGLVSRNEQNQYAWSAPLIANWFSHAGAIIDRMPWGAPKPSGKFKTSKGLKEADKPAPDQQYRYKSFEEAEPSKAEPPPILEFEEYVDIGGVKLPKRKLESEKAMPRELVETTSIKDRYVNLWFTQKRNDETLIPPNNSLLNGKVVYLRVQIAPYDYRTMLKEAKPFPSQKTLEKAFPETKGKPIPLEVTLFSTEFEIQLKERTKKVKLIAGYPTEICYFRMVPKNSGVAHLRLCVFYRNHLLQSITISAPVAEQTETKKELQSAGIEMTFSSDFSKVELLPKRGVWFGINQGTDGSHTLNIKGEKNALSRRLEEKVNTALDVARQAFIEVSFDVEVDEEKGLPKKIYRFKNDNTPKGSDPVRRFKEDLTKLAIAGRTLYDAVLGTGAIPTAEEREQVEPVIEDIKNRLRNEQVIQIARLRTLEDIWPWAIMYDLTIDPDKNKIKGVCLEFRTDGNNPLPYKECVKRCNYRDPDTLKFRDKTMVCPYGFWGFKHIIEQPTQPGGEKAFEDLTLEVKIGDDPVFEMPLEAGLMAVESEHIRAMESMKFQSMDSWEKIISALDPDKKPPEPHIMYFFCHGKYDSYKNPYLQIGKDESLTPSELDDLNFKWEHTHGLVFLNGCHTTDMEPENLSTIMAPFVKAYSSGIIGTEITVHSHLAREFAQNFFERLLPKNGRGQPVGRIIKELRLELLMKYNPLGMVYTPYCSADLHLLR